jgi:uridylate kinase
MNIIKFGGSIVIPGGNYDNNVINEFIDLVKDSKDQFMFVVGGGKLCRNVQNVSDEFLKTALDNEDSIQYAKDWLGIATTKINANYVREQFTKVFGDEVYPEIILDPTMKVESNCRIFFTGGWKPGSSTDKDMMLLAETFQAEKVFKISNFGLVKNINPIEFSKVPEADKKKVLDEAEEIKEISWQGLVDLVGTEWIPGLSTPLDPPGAVIGLKLKDKLTLYISKKEELAKILKGEDFQGTVVKG